MTNILLTDNQPIILAGLTKFLEAEKGFRLLEVSSNDEIFVLLKKPGIEIIIADPENEVFFNPDTMRKVYQAYPTIKILILSNEQRKSRVVEILQRGVHGFLTKDCDRAEFINGLKTILKGERYYGQRILDLIIENSLQPEKISGKKNGSALTVREAELLTLIASGYSNQRAALAMNLSPHTVHTHRKKIVKKLHIKSPTEFLIHALDLGLVELPTRM